MASLIEQMQELQRQQSILAEKIKQEEERNKKLSNKASIERLEALIEPITEYLDRIEQNPHRRNEIFPSIRERLNMNLEKQEKTRLMKNESIPFNRQNHITNIKYNLSHMLANEEIFVTLMGIIKQQEKRIHNLESIMQNNRKTIEIQTNNYDIDLELPANR